MCLLFVCSNPNAKDDEYALIIASIRDEWLPRETRTVHFWERNSNILGGMDIAEGNEGGTWLAMDRSTGRIGVLLNILTPFDEIYDGQLRGRLVPQYLESPMRGTEFLSCLQRSCRKYKPYLMVAIDLRPSLVVSYYSNMDSLSPTVFEGSGTYGFGNSIPSKQWKKTEIGRQIFESVTLRHQGVQHKKSLVTALFTAMSSKTRYLPDLNLATSSRGYGDEFTFGLSSMNVNVESYDFGTKTQSIILVDNLGHVDYVERTMGKCDLYSNYQLSIGQAEPVPNHMRPRL